MARGSTAARRGGGGEILEREEDDDLGDEHAHIGRRGSSLASTRRERERERGLTIGPPTGSCGDKRNGRGRRAEGCNAKPPSLRVFRGRRTWSPRGGGRCLRGNTMMCSPACDRRRCFPGSGRVVVSGESSPALVVRDPVRPCKLLALLLSARPTYVVAVQSAAAAMCGGAFWKSDHDTHKLLDVIRFISIGVN